MSETWLLLGAPGVGKSTFSYHLKQHCSHFSQFSVRLYTEQLLQKDCELGKFLRENHIVKPKSYMPNEVVEQIFGDFLRNIHRSDFLLIEGFPINRDQFEGMLRQLSSCDRKINGVLMLTDRYERILGRIKQRKVCKICEKKNGAGIPVAPGLDRCPICGGALTRRAEDDIEFFHDRYQKFLEEKQNICSWFGDDMILYEDMEQISLKELCDQWQNRINRSYGDHQETQ